MTPVSSWSELAAMLTVLGILGSIFTGIVYVLIDKRFARFMKEMRGEFVSKETFDSSIDGIWRHIGGRR